VTQGILDFHFERFRPILVRQSVHLDTDGSVDELSARKINISRDETIDEERVITELYIS
jgi:hypothetical protein